MVDPPEPNFRSQRTKMFKSEAIEYVFPKLYTFSKSTEPLSKNHHPSMTLNEHVYVICYWQEVDHVISTQNEKTVKSYFVVKLWSCNHFVTVEVAAEHIDDSIKWKSFHVSIKKLTPS